MAKGHEMVVEDIRYNDEFQPGKQINYLPDL